MWVEQDSAVKGGQKSAKGGLGLAVLGPSPNGSVGWRSITGNGHPIHVCEPCGSGMAWVGSCQARGHYRY